jgi:hypothetical protein
MILAGGRLLDLITRDLPEGQWLIGVDRAAKFAD